MKESIRDARAKGEREGEVKRCVGETVKVATEIHFEQREA